jgi:hypothetical protein
MRRTIKIPLYYTSVQVRVVSNPRKCVLSIYKNNNSFYEESEEDKKDHRGYTFNLDCGTHYIVLNKEQITHGMLAHEAQHVCDAISEYLGNTEVDKGYLIEFIIDGIYAFLKKKGVNVL